jgi:glycosyltransferase involved in cell wall biosynthesis
MGGTPLLLEDELPLMNLPRLYTGADAFVLPSRGEGWGRPHIEAMAMGLPTIATNWSGNTGKCKE